MDAPPVVLKSLGFAGRVFPNIRTQMDATDSASDFHIGLSLLRNFRITADWSAHALWLAERILWVRERSGLRMAIKPS